MTETKKATSDTAEAQVESGKAHAKHAADDIMAAASDLKSAATTKAEELRKVATEKAQGYRKVAEGKATEYRAKADAAVADAKVKAKTFQDDSEKYIRENPLRAVGTAFAVGLVIGLITRR